MKQKLNIRIIGLILMAISALFLVRRVILLDVKLTNLLTLANLLMIISVAIFGVMVIFINSICWRLCLKLFITEKIPIFETFSVYARANLLKYLPGNVGHYAGRQLYGMRLGLKQSQLAAATLMELAYSACILLLCAVFFSGEIAASTVLEPFGATPHLPVLAVVFAALVVGGIYLFRKNTYIQLTLGLIRSLRFWRTFICCLLFNAIGLCVFASGYVVLLSQYTKLNPHLLETVFAANFIAILTGMISVGAPGGIGVREATLLVLLEPFFPENIVILAACSHRIATILMDLLAVPISVWLENTFPKR